MRVHHKITVIEVRRPAEPNINQQLQWLGSSLGLFQMRDKDKSCFRLFIELIRNAKTNQAATSDELAFKLNLTRGTVVHHLHKLLDAGIVVQADRGYILRVDNLQDLIAEVEKDMQRTFSQLKDMARTIDYQLGL